jgi:hypothetical protein
VVPDQDVLLALKLDRIEFQVSSCRRYEFIHVDRLFLLYPPSQKAPSGRAGMNAKRVSTVAS